MKTSNATEQVTPKAATASKPRVSEGRGRGRGAHAPSRRGAPITVPIGSRVRAIRTRGDNWTDCDGVVAAVVPEGILVRFDVAPYNREEYPTGKLEGLLWDEVLLDLRPPAQVQQHRRKQRHA